MSNTIKDIHAKIDRNFPDNTEKCDLICTLLGSAATLTEFLMANHHPSEIPINVQYSVMITSINMIGMIGDGIEFEKVNMDEEIDFKISEQTQEIIYRKMKKAVDIIVNHFKKFEAEYDI